MPNLGIWDPTEIGLQDQAFGPPPFDSAQDDSYDQVILADLPGTGWYWKLNESAGTTLADRGRLGRTLTLSGGSAQVNYAAGPTTNTPINNSVRFDGANNSKATANPFSVNFPARSPFSLELWLQPTLTPTANGFVLCNFAVGAVGGWDIRYMTTGLLRMQRTDVTGTSDAISAAVAPLRWTHVVYTYDGSNMNMYRDGVLVAGPTASTRDIGSNIFPVLCMGNFSPTGTGNAYTGYLARVAIYSTALSAIQVQTHFAAASPFGTIIAPTNPLGLQLGSLKWEQDFPQEPAAGGAPVTVSPSVGLLTLSADTDIPAIAMAPTLGTLTLSSSAPTVAEAMTPTIGNLTLGAVSSPPAIAVTPTPATLTLSANAPTVAITIDGTATVDTAILLLQGGSNAPTSVVSPSIGNLTLSAVAPTVAERLTPPIGNLLLGADAPTIVSGIFVNEPIGTLALSAVAPALLLSVAPSPAVLTLSGGANTTSGGTPSSQQDQSAPQWLFFLR